MDCARGRSEGDGGGETPAPCNLPRFCSNRSVAGDGFIGVRARGVELLGVLGEDKPRKGVEGDPMAARMPSGVRGGEGGAGDTQAAVSAGDAVTVMVRGALAAQEKSRQLLSLAELGRTRSMDDRIMGSCVN